MASREAFRFGCSLTRPNRKHSFAIHIGRSSARRQHGISAGRSAHAAAWLRLVPMGMLQKAGLIAQDRSELNGSAWLRRALGVICATTTICACA
jgi:hypothetical protein